jgi:HNH endonuclease
MRDRRSDTTHRVAARAKVGRTLTSSDIVDHLDENKANNAAPNLDVTTRSAHGKRHARDRKSGLSALRSSLAMQRTGKKSY